MAPSPDRFETVAYIYSPSDLALLLSLLGHQGFHVQTAGHGHASVQPGLTTALGGVEVRVHEFDAADARRLLTQLDPEQYRAPLLLGFWPLDLVFFLVVGLLGMAPPPRQLPCYVRDEALHRPQD